MNITCPACNFSEGTPGVALRLTGLAKLCIHCCAYCGHRWLPTSAGEQRAIEDNYGADYDGFRADAHFTRVMAGQLSTRLRHLRSRSAALLDVGCGNGEFLRQASNAGFVCQGIDISAAAARLCTEKGLQATAGDFLSHQFGRVFDLVTMWDVVEHLREPFEFVARAFELLQPGGTLVLKIPSPGALNFELLRVLPGRAGALLGAPAHVQYFTEASLAALLRRAGFQQIVWFQSIAFRGRPRSWSPRRLLRRQLSSLASRLTRNTNLYALAVKGQLEPQLVARLSARRVQSFDPAHDGP